MATSQVVRINKKSVEKRHSTVCRANYFLPSETDLGSSAPSLIHTQIRKEEIQGIIGPNRLILVLMLPPAAGEPTSHAAISRGCTEINGVY